MQAKFMFVRPVLPVLMSFVPQTDSLIPFIEKYISKTKKLCAMHVKTYFFSLTFALQKSCA